MATKYKILMTVLREESRCLLVSSMRVVIGVCMYIIGTPRVDEPPALRGTEAVHGVCRVTKNVLDSLA